MSAGSAQYIVVEHFTWGGHNPGNNEQTTAFRHARTENEIIAETRFFKLEKEHRSGSHHWHSPLAVTATQGVHLHHASQTIARKKNPFQVATSSADNRSAAVCLAMGTNSMPPIWTIYIPAYIWVVISRFVAGLIYFICIYTLIILVILHRSGALTAMSRVLKERLPGILKMWLYYNTI